MDEVKRRSQEVTVEDGTRLRLEHFAQTTEGGPVVLCLPAMGVQARYYEPLAQELHRQGLHVVTSDLRGHGASSVQVGRGTRFGYYELVTRDWRAVVRAVRQEYPDSPLFLLGHSLGGQLSALYTSLDGGDIQGLVMVAACSVYYRSYGLVGGAKVLFGTQLAALIGTLWGYFPGRQLRFAGNEAAGVMRDWARQARTGRYTLANAPEDFEQLLSRVDPPLLAISVDGDTLAPPAAVEHLCGKMPRAKLTRWHYSQAEAEAGRLDHFRWVRQSAPVARRIRSWVDEVCQAGGTPGDDMERSA